MKELVLSLIPICYKYNQNEENDKKLIVDIMKILKIEYRLNDYLIGITSEIDIDNYLLEKSKSNISEYQNVRTNIIPKSSLQGSQGNSENISILKVKRKNPYSLEMTTKKKEKKRIRFLPTNSVSFLEKHMKLINQVIQFQLYKERS